MKNKILLILISILLLLSGTYVFYLYGYKEMMLVYIFSFIAIVFGWILLLTGLISLRKSKVHTPGITAEKEPSGFRKFLTFLGMLAFIFLLIAHYMYLFFLSGERVQKILETQPTKTTTATVIQLKERHGKTGSRLYAVLNYNTDAGERTEEMRIAFNEFSIGEKFTIKYSVEYPDMFEIVQQY